uniref:Putative ixodegrin n=1 Tax=Rhipicephalus pulchellus TaxID=72859 RepID=L7LQX7_RHIPC
MKVRTASTMCLYSMIGTTLVILMSTSQSSGFDIIFPETGCPELKRERTKGPIVPLSAPKLKGVGESCEITTECQEGLGCLQQDHVDTCQWMSLFGESCSPYQIKGGVYHEDGPCLNGDGYCINGTCVA